MGGVTVNINEPVAIEGNTDAGIPPIGYLEPGPDQHLDGYHALWFARGRYGSDDYARMERQRCMVDALVEAANPMNLLTRYLDLVKAGEDIIYTDIPLDVAPAFVDLALEVKGAKVKSVVFRSSEEFYSGDPDYDYVRETVQKALFPPPRKPGAPKPPKTSDDTEDACAYDPEGTVTAAE
jgi:anionic cell wall polymer biosynthesis LytR-Cps2A-Psr (LCP) family protein